MASSTPRTLWAGRLSTNHNVSALEHRSQTLLEVGQKDFAVHCSVDQHRRDYSGETQARNDAASVQGFLERLISGPVQQPPWTMGMRRAHRTEPVWTLTEKV